jgi:hypothetical protein
VLKVEQVMRVPGQQSHPGVEVRALEVGHDLKTLLPYGVLLMLNQEKRDRQCYSSGEAVLTQGGESHVRHQLNVGVRLATDDEPQPRLRGVKGYHHADLALVHAMGRGQSAMADQSVIGSATVAVRRSSHKEARAMCANNRTNGYDHLNTATCGVHRLLKFCKGRS